MQVHTVAELERVLQLKLDGCMLGINNRDLGTFQVDLHNNKAIMESPAGQQVPHSSPRLAASGMYVRTEGLAHWLLCGSVCELNVKWQHVTQPLRATTLSSTSKGYAAQACCSLCYDRMSHCISLLASACILLELAISSKAQSKKGCLPFAGASLGTRCMRHECTSCKGSTSMQVVARDILIAGESGIFTPEDVAFVQSTGCGAVLVGESLVKTGDPAAAVKTLLG